MRLHALGQLNLLDTPPSESFDRITRMASQLFGLPIAAISLTDHDRQWFKSRVGVEHWQIPREKAPCAEVSTTAAPVVIPDLLADECYRDSLLARSGIRFYAGSPLITRDGFGLGAMCVLGTEPREASAEERQALTDLAAMVMAQVELRHAFGRVEPISGLPNRHQLLDDLRDQVRDDPGGLRSAVLIEILPTTRIGEMLRVLGPNSVDDLVRNSTRLLWAALGPGAKLYQVGPTQFAWFMVHPDIDDRDAAHSRVGERIEAYLQSSNSPALRNPAVGIAHFRLGDASPEDLLRTVHGAAQDARNADLRVSLYSESADDDHRRRFRLLADLPAALAASDQLSLAYQPRVSLRSEACVGAEALLRWHHPTLGNVPPGEFMPLAEQTDLARPVTEWVLGAAVAQAQHWLQGGLAVPISVNVSAADLDDPDFSRRLIERLTSSSLPEGAIEIEVTESALIRDGLRVDDHLRTIRQAGIKVAIDDFGTGYSSLSYLKELPADAVKIDQSFIRDLAASDRGKTLVRSIVDMAKGLGLRVIAEGVEDAETYAFLRAASCNEVQGYFVSRPVPPEAFAAWLAKTAHAGRNRRPAKPGGKSGH